MKNALGQQELSMSYAGDLTPEEAWQFLQKHNDAELVDVRTVPEWYFVGGPNLKTLNKEVKRVSWRSFPSMQINQNFCEQLAKDVPNKEAPLLFICRTGARSLDAAIAMTEFGYGECYNVIDGFEGDMDNAQRRGAVNGWKASNLPWEQN